MVAPASESGRTEGGARITTEIGAAVLLIAAPLWFNTTFALLGKRFDYPDILRRPVDEILRRFAPGGQRVGSGGRIRTYDMAVNSRPLYH